MPLQQPAQRQAVQALDSTRSPGAILSPFHKTGARAAGGRSSSIPPAPTCPRLLGLRSERLPRPAPAGQPSKAPRPTQDGSSRPRVPRRRPAPAEAIQLGITVTNGWGSLKTVISGHRLSTGNGPNTSGKRPPSRKRAGGRTWRPGLALVPVPGFLTTSPRERRGAGRLHPAGL